VIEHLRKRLPNHWRATLLAVDGSVASGVSRQLGGLPADATHLVVSTGGNNALDHARQAENSMEMHNQTTRQVCRGMSESLHWRWHDETGSEDELRGCMQSSGLSYARRQAAQL
jgi:hypothetical protein